MRTTTDLPNATQNWGALLNHSTSQTVPLPLDVAVGMFFTFLRFSSLSSIVPLYLSRQLQFADKRWGISLRPRLRRPRSIFPETRSSKSQIRPRSHKPCDRVGLLQNRFRALDRNRIKLGNICFGLPRPSPENGKITEK